MAEANPDPRKIQEELGRVDEYQAPPREHEPSDEPAPPSGADSAVDVSRLEAQEGKHQGMSETKPHADPDPRTTVSSKDEIADPADPRAVPPGERM